MQKVYLLLRNNKQSGPFSLEELVQSGIKPLDLIWIEGASTSWGYPSEISSLKPYTQEPDATNTSSEKTVIEETEVMLPVEALSHQAYLPPARDIKHPSNEAPLNIYVSLPKNNVKLQAQQQELPFSSLEQKVAEIRARVLAYVPEQTATSDVFGNVNTVQQQDMALSSFEQKAAEIRDRALAHVPEQNISPETAQATKPVEQQDTAPSSFEQKAAEIRARALAHVPEQKISPERVNNVQPVVQRHTAPVRLEQKGAGILAKALDYIPGQNVIREAPKRIKHFMTASAKEVKASPGFQKIFVNRRELNRKSPAIITMALILIAGGYLVSRFSSGKQITNLPVTTEQANTDNANMRPLIPEPDPQQSDVAAFKNDLTEKPGQEKLIANEPDAVNHHASEPPVVSKTAPQAPVVSDTRSEPPVVTKSKPPVSGPKEETNSTSTKKIVPVLPSQSTVSNPPVTRNIENKVGAPVVKQEDHVGQTDDSEEDKKVLAEAMKKKKTFSEKIDGFFSKVSKKRLEDPEAENAPPPSTNDPRERKAVRRGDEVDNAQRRANLDEFIDVTSKESSGNWMLGVYGLKLIVHNRSSEMVKRAAVEVRYYNKHEELIEKKIVNVNNVPPNKTVTVAAPDHRLADHADLKLLSASN